jgi:hypothetical protein
VEAGITCKIMDSYSIVLSKEDPLYIDHEVMRVYYVVRLMKRRILSLCSRKSC